MDIYYKPISESGKQMINYVCKYAPVELFKGFGQECAVLEEMPENFDKSDKIAHANLCGFGKSVIQAVLEGKVEELVLVNCCDSMRRVYDIIENTKKCKFLYMLDLPHEDNECENIKFAQSILRLKKAYERYSHRTFDRELFIKSFAKPQSERKPYIGLMGVHVSSILEKTIRENMQMDVENMTCTSGRNLIILQKDLRNMDDETLFLAYAESLLGQMPCARMNNNTRRNQLFLDPSLKGIIYHTIKFCDYYGFEYASIKNNIKVPLLKLETDFTSQSAGQLLTRIQAFAETIEGSDDMDPTKGISEEARRRMESGVYYVAGIDSGSTSTDVVILDQDGKIKSTMIIPTGGGAMMSAEKSLEKAVEKAGISKDDIVRIVTTGEGAKSEYNLKNYDGSLYGLKGSFSLTGDLVNMNVDMSIDSPYEAKVKGRLNPLSNELPCYLSIESDKLFYPLQNTQSLKIKTKELSLSELSDVFSAVEKSLSPNLEKEDLLKDRIKAQNMKLLLTGAVFKEMHLTFDSEISGHGFSDLKTDIDATVTLDKAHFNNFSLEGLLGKRNFSSKIEGDLTFTDGPSYH